MISRGVQGGADPLGLVGVPLIMRRVTRVEGIVGGRR